VFFRGRALQGTALDTGINPQELVELSTYWEQTRALYAPFESNLRSSSSEVYYHEMPGGQYTNLKFQVGSSVRWRQAHDAAERCVCG
jgi:pyruvate carboxylase